MPPALVLRQRRVCLCPTVSNLYWGLLMLYNVTHVLPTCLSSMPLGRREGEPAVNVYAEVYGGVGAGGACRNRHGVTGDVKQHGKSPRKGRATRRCGAPE